MTDEMKKAINRTYKSTMFIMLYEDRENLLELYNAMSGKQYTDAGLLEINTLENAIYMSMKNDISFLIDGGLSLYEHQSTYSPNLPLRFLFYVSSLYSGMTKDANLYGTKKTLIPTPEFIIFYNGEDDLPDRQVLRLSDLYTLEQTDYRLDLEAVMLNISGNHNQKLKSACRTLREYAVYTDKMRKYSRSMPLEEAADRTIRECIEGNILRDFLLKHRSEAKMMSIFEYDQEKHIRMEREEAWEDGKKTGIEIGKKAGMEAGLLSLIEKKLARGKSVAEIAEDLEEDENVIETLINKLQ